MMNIIPITDNKKNFLPLLLIADEQESMIDKYIEKGEMFVGIKNGLAVAVCVVVCLDKETYEIKNLAVHPKHQHQGYGKAMIKFICQQYKEKCQYLLVGTGDSPLTIPFYKKCGFSYSHQIPNFFIDNYNHPIIEAGVQLVDMIYLKKTLH
ncbi:MAG: GNAT family N-acetyltransferase [Bacteroides sp.]|nr:GNAT family N-acetyltransferase [Bacteroides sp.]